MKRHPNVTADKIMAACQRGYVGLDNPGFCLACGCEVEGVEPDACNYECEACGEAEVFGAEELMLSIAN